MKNEAFWICAQTGVPAVAEGEPGSSKTHSIGGFAKAVGRHFIDVRPSSLMPEDLGGYPHMVDGRFRLSPPFFIEEIIDKFKEGLKTVNLFDELTTCPASKQAPLLRWLEAGKLPCDAWVVGACNPEELAADGQPFEAPLINRICLLEWEQDRAAWKHGIVYGWEDQQQPYPILPAHWRSMIPAQASLVGMFSDMRPELWQDCPKERSAAAKPWPSQRSWTNAATLMGAAEAVGATELAKERLVAGCVGKDASLEFFTWLKELDLVDPEELLAKPKSYKKPDRPDKVWATASAVAAATLRELTPDRYVACLTVMGLIADDHADIAAVNAEVVMKHPSVSIKNGFNPPAAVVNKLLPIMRRIGW